MHSRERVNIKENKVWQILKYSLFNIHILFLAVISGLCLFSALVVRDTYSWLPCLFLFAIFASVIGFRLFIAISRTKENKLIKDPTSSVLTRTLELFFVLLTCVSLLLILIFTLAAISSSHVSTSSEINLFLANKINEFLLAAPAGLIYFANIIEFITYLRLRKQDINEDVAGLDNLARAKRLVIVGLDAFKTKNKEVEGSISLSGISTDEINQIISNIIEYTKEDNYYDSLCEYYRCFNKSEIISSIKYNDINRYGAVTFSTGVTYLFGEPQNMKIENEGAYQKINELQEMGYKVLVLSKGIEQIEGDTYLSTVTAIALVLLRDELQEGTKEVFDYLSNQGIDVKVLSGSSVENTQFILKKAGFMNANSVCHFDENELKFTDEGALYCDLNVNSATVLMEQLNEQNIPTAYITEGFNRTVEKIEKGKEINSRLNAIASLYVSKSIFAIILSITFFIISLVTSYTYQYPFTYNNFLLWEVFSIMLPSFYLLTEKSSKDVEPSFLKSVFKKVLPISVLFTLGTLLAFIAYILYINGIIYTGIEDYGLIIGEANRFGATGIAVITITILSFVAIYIVIRKIFKKSATILAFTIIPTLLITIVMVIVGPNTNWINIDFNKILPVNYLAAGIISLAVSALVLIVVVLIDVIRGEKND
ncbi:MAG: hypothetical protein K5925_02905 [Bacilli bacterium]|nr:hypothetical protein [Bacilli bacterium]